MEPRARVPHLTPVLRASWLALWWWLVVVGAVAVIVTAGADLDLDVVRVAGSGFWVLGGLVLLGELRPVIASTRTDPAGINLATAFLFAALLRWGLEPVLLTVPLATLLGEVARRKAAYRAAFNVAQYVLSYAAAALVLQLGGWPATVDAPATLAAGDLGLVLLAAAAYHVTNVVCVGTAVACEVEEGWWRSILDDIGWHTVTTGAILGLSPLVVVVLATDVGFLPLLLLPLYLLWTTANEALAREHAAATDPLTGVANRAGLAERVAEHAGSTPDRPLTLCVIDLDRFKEVNDTLGHATGDALLCAVAERLRHAVRDGDHVSRLGGDEFVLALDGVDAEGAAAILDRVAASVHRPFELDGVRLEVEMSVGVAVSPDDGDDLEVLLRRADAAMYEAKSTGEVVRVFRADLERHAPSRLALLAELRHAIDAGELELHFQPQVALPDGEVLGVEALLRWRHPIRGLLAPGRFLPVARRTATMRLVTATVLELAFEQLVTWRRLGLTTAVSINASPHDLADAGFADRVVRGLAAHGLPPGALRVEITEEALGDDPDRVLATIDLLVAAGVELSLDDFGMGHASLTRLKSVPITEVKFDRSLVADLAAGATRDVAIVRSVLDLTAALGLRSLAEGVETPEQRDALSELGCGAVQGWLVAEALPAAEATTWLLDHRLDLPPGSGVTVGALDRDR